jgi:hypothetical protein
VIANIESGRKTDVTIDQLIAMAWALIVPPVVLALPIEEPSVDVRMTENPLEKQLLWVLDAVLWFNADPDLTAEIPEGPGLVLAPMLLKAAKEFQTAVSQLRKVEAGLSSGKFDQSMFDEALEYFEKTAAPFRTMGAVIARLDEKMPDDGSIAVERRGGMKDYSEDNMPNG